MRVARAVPAVAAVLLLGACGGGVSDPKTAACPAPPATSGSRSELVDHAEIPLGFTCADAKIAGTLYLPLGNGRRPALVWVHGANESPRLHWGDGAFLRPFTQAGFAVYSFDKRGVAESGGECCPGDHGHFNLATADVVGAVGVLRRRAEIDPEKVGLFGASQAGWVAPRAGEDYTIHVYPKANHGFFDVPPTDTRALPDTLRWLRDRAS